MTTWWAGWVVSLLLARPTLGGSTLADERLHTVLYLASEGAGIAAGLLFLRVLTQITERQRARAAESGLTESAYARD